MSEALVQLTAECLAAELPDATITRHGDLMKATLSEFAVTVSHAEMCVTGAKGIPTLVKSNIARARYISGKGAP